MYVDSNSTIMMHCRRVSEGTLRHAGRCGTNSRSQRRARCCWTKLGTRNSGTIMQFKGQIAKSSKSEIYHVMDLYEENIVILVYKSKNTKINSGKILTRFGTIKRRLVSSDVQLPWSKLVQLT